MRATCAIIPCCLQLFLLMALAPPPVSGSSSGWAAIAIWPDHNVIPPGFESPVGRKPRVRRESEASKCPNPQPLSKSGAEIAWNPFIRVT